MKKVFVVICLIQFLSGCPSLPGSERHQKEMAVIQELVRDPATRKFKGNEGDVSNLRGCGILFELGNWELRKSKNYGRGQSWFGGGMVTVTGFSIDFDPKKNSSFFTKQKLTHLVYIGPWRLTTLTHKSTFPFTKPDSETKLIRFFAYQKKEGGEIRYQYESQTPENKNIKEKPFSLSPNAKYPPDNFSLCVVKWTAKYGYNAIAEVKSKNPFSKNYLVPTGRIIDSETSEVIADDLNNPFESRI